MSPRIGLLAQASGAPLTSSAWIRLLLPFQRLQQQGELTVCQLESPENWSHLETSLTGLDVLVVQRASCQDIEQAHQLVAVCRRSHLPLVVDLDDALFALPIKHPERQRYAPLIPALDYLLSEADLRVFSTATLAELCHERLIEHDKILGPFEVLMNGLDPDLWTRKVGFPRRDSDGPLRLLYMGSRTHDADFELLMPSLDRWAESVSNAFQLTLVGGVSAPVQRPWLNVVDVPLKVRRYPQFVHWLRKLPRHDLGLAPLVANTFNAAKSDVKLLDYAALGLPALCSPGPAYAKHIEAGLALVAEPQDWKRRLQWSAAHRGQLRRIAQLAHAELWSERTSETMAQGWLNVLNSITSKHHRGR